MALPFLLSTASIAGAAHRRDDRNNQDAVVVHAEEELRVAVVADGCSSSPRSEVGAALGARWLAEWVPTYLRYERDPAALLAQVRAGLLEYLAAAIDGLRPSQRERAKTVQELFLFTFLVAAVDAERALVFGLGDGMFAVDGQVTALDAGPDGAPPYLAYELIRPALQRDPGPLQPVLLHAAPTEGLRSLCIASDGVLGLRASGEQPTDALSPLWGEPGFAQDRGALERHLRENAPRLEDDATAALFRRH